MPVRREQISQAYRDAGMEPRNLVWGWSAREEQRPAILLQLWANTKLKQEPILGPPVEGAYRYLTFTTADYEAWCRDNERLGKQPPNQLLGWNWWKQDLEWAKKRGASVCFILVLYRMRAGEVNDVDDDALGIRSATFRNDWTGRVTYLDTTRNEYEVAILVNK